MSNTNTGGPAFPSGMQQQADDILDSLHKGMTMRDYFASKAMQAIIANSDQESVAFEEVGNWVGGYAYEVADAMLKARKA